MPTNIPNRPQIPQGGGGVSPTFGPDPKQTGFPYARTIVLGSVRMPGKWTLRGGARKFGWQQQKGFGLSGAYSFPTGDELVEPEFDVEIWASQDAFNFRAIRAKLLSHATYTVAGTSSSKAMGIHHPELKAMGVISVVLQEITPLVQDDYGLWTCSAKFLQFRPPKLGPAKPLASIPDTAAPTPTAQDQADIELQKLTDEINKLTGT